MKKLTLFFLLLTLFCSWGCIKENADDRVYVVTRKRADIEFFSDPTKYIYDDNNNLIKTILFDDTGAHPQDFIYKGDSILKPDMQAEFSVHKDQYEVYRLRSDGLVQAFYARYYNYDTDFKEFLIRYEYNNEGYLSKTGGVNGYTLYEYEKGNLARKKRFSLPDNTLQTITHYTYDMNTPISETKLIDGLSKRFGKGNKNLLLEQRIEYIGEKEGLGYLNKITYKYEMNDVRLPKKITQTYTHNNQTIERGNLYEYEKR